MNLSDRISRNPDLGLSEGDRELHLNSVAAEIWKLLEIRPMSLSEVCAHIRKLYDVEDFRCIADVENFINEMVAAKRLLVTPVTVSEIWLPPTITCLSQAQVAGGSTSNQLENSSGLIGS